MRLLVCITALRIQIIIMHFAHFPITESYLYRQIGRSDFHIISVRTLFECPLPILCELCKNTGRKCVKIMGDRGLDCDKKDSYRE